MSFRKTKTTLCLIPKMTIFNSPSPKFPSPLYLSDFLESHLQVDPLQVCVLSIDTRHSCNTDNLENSKNKSRRKINGEKQSIVGGFEKSIEVTRNCDSAHLFVLSFGFSSFYFSPVSIFRRFFRFGRRISTQRTTK